MSPVTFLGLEGADADYDTSRSVILPAPYERTTSYGRGTAGGPAAILAASQQVELYDEELRLEPCSEGIATLPPVALDDLEPAAAIAAIGDEVGRHLAAGKFVVTLGGEHALSLGPVRAARDAGGPIGVVQFDAHADLRDEYEGSRHSHASVMRRILDEEIPSLAIGIRALSREEGVLVARSELPVVWGRELADLTAERFNELLEALPDRVYLTFDVDYFDPAVMPATGTPEPGGGLWYPTLALLRALFAAKDVVAMDVVELAPIAGQPASDFTAARLVYKCLGYRRAGERG